MESQQTTLLRPNALASCDTPNEFSMVVSPEKWRLIAYLWFCFTIIFSIIMSKIFVVPYLANGPEDGKSCAPFERDNAEFGVSPGQGFDFPSQTHLIETFGYNNICTNWDYSPSRELTAMVYPLSEYSLLIYVCLDFMVVLLTHQRGEIKAWFWCLTKFLFPFLLFLISQFRMIFVCIAYEAVQQHTAGFLGLQIALIIIATQNTLFVWDSNTAYKFLGGPQEGLVRTRLISLVYVILNLIISGFKIYSTAFVVITGKAAPWTLQDTGIPGVIVAQILDSFWMIFNLVLPMIFAFVRSKFDKPVNVTFSQTQLKYLIPGKVV